MHAKCMRVAIEPYNSAAVLLRRFALQTDCTVARPIIGAPMGPSACSDFGGRSCVWERR